LGSVIGCVGIFELIGDNLEGIMVNDSYFKFTNIGIGDENVLSWVLHEDKETVLSTLHRCEKSNKVESCQICCKKLDGDIIWISANARCLAYESYRSLFYIAISDITQIKMHEQNYYAELNKFKGISRFLNEQILDYDVTKDVLSFLIKDVSNTENGLAVDFRKNIMLRETIHPNYKEVCAKCLEEAVSKVCHGVLKFKSSIAGEGYQWYRVSYTSIADEGGKITRVVGRMENIENQIHLPM
jgi:uncharacterized protein (DUF427 family)